MNIIIEFSDNIKHYYNSFEEILKLDNYNDIIYIYCPNNNLSWLPELPNSLMFIFHNNPIYTHIGTHFNGDANKYFEHQKKIENIFANKIGDWFLDCKYNPKYLYCRKRLMKEYEELYG